jgi:hypothetical protein
MLLAILAVPAWSQDQHARRDVRPHASAEFTPFVHSTGAYSLEHPSDWKAHERGPRTNIGADDGLVPTERGFRTIYGAIVQIADDPLAGKPERSAEASARSIVEQVLARNPHQALKEPLASDGTLAGAPAFRAVINGISPVTGRGERADIIVRQHGDARIFYVVLVSPIDDHPSLAAALKRLRDSIRIPAS